MNDRAPRDTTNQLAWLLDSPVSSPKAPHDLALRSSSQTEPSSKSQLSHRRDNQPARRGDGRLV